MSRATLWWGALVLPLWAVLALCTHWEPVTRDGWGHIYWHLSHDVTPASIATFFKDSYLGSNPRLGQTWTLLVYTPGPFHAIATPILELGAFLLLTTLALGRWPSVRRADDALVALTVTAIVAVCTPQIGPMLFYRPFTGNYLLGLVLNLLWLVPYRLHVESPRDGRLWRTPAMLLLGLAAGLCNEHTGPAFLGMGALALLVSWRAAGARARAWMLAGLVGLAAGYLLLLLAPGHDHRYSGLANQAGVLERITARGLTANLVTVGRFAAYLAYALPWFLLALVARSFVRTSDSPPPGTWTPATRRSLAVLALGGLLCTLTLLASPKLGPRLYLASTALGGTALAACVCAHLRARWARITCALLAAAVLAFGAWRSLATYHSIAPIGVARLRLIQDTPNGQAIVVPRYPPTSTRWFLGDDFLVTTLRQALANDYGLTGIDLEGEERM